MPVYVYRVVGSASAEGEPEETFEVRQSIHDAPLTKHPETGQPVERVLCAPRIGRGKLTNRELNAAGFTKYARMSDGTYEKQAGAGPSHVDPH